MNKLNYFNDDYSIKPLKEWYEGRRVYMVTSPLIYTSSTYGTIVVPVGFKTDLASVPRLLTSIFPPDGRYLEAAIVHDYLYENAIGTKKKADKMFREGMKVLEVKPWRRFFMYWSVRILGYGSYPLPY